jgi:hypothetical protein
MINRKAIQDFQNNKQGIVLEVLLTVVFIFATGIIGIVGALLTSKIADSLTPFLGSNVNALTVVTNARNAYIAGIVVTDITLLIYMFVSAQKRESQERPAPGVFY